MNIDRRIRYFILLFSISWISCSVIPASEKRCISAHSLFDKYEYIIEGRHLVCSGGITNAMVTTSTCNIQIDTIYKAPQYLLDSFELKRNMVFEKGPHVIYLNDPNKLLLRYWRQTGFAHLEKNIPDNILELHQKWITEKKIFCFNSESFQNNYPIINEIKYCKYSERLASKLKRISKKREYN